MRIVSSPGKFPDLVLSLTSPADGATVAMPFLLQGDLRDGTGTRSTDARLTWSLNGERVGSGWTCQVRHDPGLVVVELLAYLGDELVARKQVRITVEGTAQAEDCD